MSSPGKLMFAVTREDPEIEILIHNTINPKSILTVASGGCLPFQLKHMFPKTRVVAFDFNYKQIEHCKIKAQKIKNNNLLDLNIDNNDSRGINQCGQFESMFRTLRFLFIEFLSSEEEINDFFSDRVSIDDRRNLIDSWVANPYWEVIFYMTFCDRFINIMFDESATQHAPPDSMPKYFMNILENGFRKTGSYKNPWLQHIFLGRYKKSDCLSYLNSAESIDIEFVHGPLLSVKDINKFQLVSLSNIFDWSDDSIVESWSNYLMELDSGAYVIIRQLNNERDLIKFFNNGFKSIESIGERTLDSLVRSDRSLFYNKFIVLVRT